MDKNLYKKKEPKDFSNPGTQKAYIEEARSGAELIRKEMIVNQTEQVLLAKRIQMLREFLNDLPASDPQYNMCILTAEMDEIELNELKLREMILEQRLDESK